MFASLLALLFVQGVAASASAGQPSGANEAAKPPRLEGRHLVTDPAWLVKPSRSEVLDAFPSEAASLGVGGRGIVACTIDAEGAAQLCEMIGEEPLGFGFGNAAKALAPAMRFTPATVDGRVVGDSRIAIPIRFDPPEPASGQGWAQTKVSWLKAPDAAQIQAAYPPLALKAKRTGVGVIRCTIRSGLLADCKALVDDPDHFGRAALKLSPFFLMEDTFGGGTNYGAIVDIPVAFGPAPLPARPSAQADVVEAAPTWTRQPTPDLIAAAFPVDATAAGVKRIEVKQVCRVQANGGLTACALRSESPAGFGGAQAAARLANVYQTSIWLPEGRPSAGSVVQLPIVLERAAADSESPRSTLATRPAMRPRKTR